MKSQTYQGLFSETRRLTANTCMCIERTIGRALFGHRGGAAALRSAVCRATRELREQGLDDLATLAILGAFVEDAGRSCRADRTSLVSGEPVWMQLRRRVLASAELELSRLTAAAG
ncbi:MAG TPA: hypothetical protein VFT29_08870 [Gemmatimonadaceae bacterium]|nr:hypothetical protein [Gemmatimonadaceae bacterium]